MKTFAAIFSLSLFLMPMSAWADGVELRSRHPFTVEQARERVQLMLDYWKERYGVDFYWSGPKAYVSGRLYGVQVDAVLEINGQEVAGEFQDPGPFFRDSARQYLQKKLHKYLHPQFQEV